MARSNPPVVVITAQEAKGLTWTGPVPVTDAYAWNVPPLGRATLSRDDDGAIRADITWRPGGSFEYDEKYHEFGYGKAGDRVVELAIVPIETKEASDG